MLSTLRRRVTTFEPPTPKLATSETCGSGGTIDTGRYAAAMVRCSATGGSRPTLSVITPSFNSSSFLGDTLESVAALSTAHEHLVIDGGSSDDTVELLEHRHDPDLAWMSESDRGQTHAVNKGLDRARGEFLSWLNADDLYIPENVDAAIGLLRSDPSVDAIFGHMDIIDANGATTGRYRCGRFSWLRYLYFGEYIPTPTIIFRHSILSDALRLDESYVDAADYDFYLRLLRGRCLRNVNQPLVRFRYHSNSKTASNSALQVEEAHRIRLRYARGAGERWLMAAAFRVMRARGALASPWPEL